MTKLRNMKAAVVLGSLTATVALLTGLPAASAQTAPGGGSFPGSFLVPGTNTSLAIHGIIWFDATHDFGPHQGDTTAGITGFPLNGQAGHNFNGGTFFTVKPTRPNIETRTPTAYGELKTYIEFDMNEFKNQTGSVGQGNADGFRLRQAYGTLGPLLVGQANSNFADPQSWPESIDATIDPGTMNTATVRQPQIRYTYLAGNGLSVAGSVEQNESQLGTGSAAATSLAGHLTDNTTGGGYSNWPDLVGSVNWSQPWGNLGAHAAVHQNELRSTTTTSHTETGYAFSVTGHLNTIGKDALRAGVTYIDGASNYISFASPSVIENTTTGEFSTQKAWGGWGGYTHFWAANLRSTVHGGYVHFDKPSAASGLSTAALAGIEKRWWAGHVNLIWSPVPQTDFGIEYVYWNREVQSGAKGTDQRVDLQLKFYF